MGADPEVMRHFPALQTPEQANASIDAWQADFAERGWSNWAVARRADGAFVGFVGLTVPRRTLPFTPCVEIGWRLARQAWGQGLASEAARAVLDCAFGTLRLDEVLSFTAECNTRSLALMQRIGLRDLQRPFGHPALPEGHALRPHRLFGLRRSEWAEAGRPAG